MAKLKQLSQDEIMKSPDATLLEVASRLFDVIEWINEYERDHTTSDSNSKPWPQLGDTYFAPDPSLEKMFVRGEWDGVGYEQVMLDRGLVFKTQEEAVEVAEKMLKGVSAF